MKAPSWLLREMNAPPWLLKICQVLLIFAVTAGVLMWLVGTQIHNWYEARQMAKSDPYLAMVPHPLPDVNPSPATGTTLTAFGYEFEVPWPSPVKSHIQDRDAAYLFPDGHWLIFQPPPAMEGIFAILGGYPVLKKELYMTPDQVSLFLWRRESAQRMLLLEWKSIQSLRHAKGISALYTFERQGLRGFQIGDPTRDDLIQIVCFDSGDHRLEIYFSRRNNSRPIQPDIDRVIETLHPITPPPNGEEPR